MCTAYLFPPPPSNSFSKLLEPHCNLLMSEHKHHERTCYDLERVIKLVSPRESASSVRHRVVICLTCPTPPRWRSLNLVLGQVHTLTGLTDTGGQVTCLAISPDGKRVVGGSDADIVKSWDTGSGAEVSSSAAAR